MTDYENKAVELIGKFYHNVGSYQNKVQCAIILVDEILKNIEATIFYHKESIALPENKDYWLKVREALTVA